MTVNLDITNVIEVVKNNDYKIFPVILYMLSQIVNRHKEFRMDLDEDKSVGITTIEILATQFFIMKPKTSQMCELNIVTI